MHIVFLYFMHLHKDSVICFFLVQSDLKYSTCSAMAAVNGSFVASATRYSTSFSTPCREPVAKHKP